MPDDTTSVNERNLMEDGREIKIKSVDMPEEMQRAATDLAAEAFEKFSLDKEIASYIKKEFDRQFKPTWHCVVGTHFGVQITHETELFIYFTVGIVAVLLFRSGR